MLSDREQQELARIEAALKAEDRSFADGLRTGPRIDRTRRWPARATLFFGVSLLVIGALTSAGMLVFQGIVCAAAGVLWLRWQATRRGRSDGTTFPARPAGHPDGPPTGRDRAA